MSSSATQYMLLLLAVSLPVQSMKAVYKLTRCHFAIPGDADYVIKLDDFLQEYPHNIELDLDKGEATLSICNLKHFTFE